MSIDYDDTDAEVIAYDEEYEIEYPSVSGLEGGGNNVVNLYNIFGFPTFYVIDSSKTIVQEIDPPTLVVFDFRFNELGISPADCNPSEANILDVRESLILFPNPVKEDMLFIQNSYSFDGVTSFEIFDMTGNLIKNGVLHFSNNSLIEIEIGELPVGCYIVYLKSKGGNKFSEKFIRK